MSTELKTWERPHYTAGGGEPLLFYIVFGEIDQTEPLSRGKYRSNGPVEGIDVRILGPDDPQDVIDEFREGFVWEQFATGNPFLASEVAECPHCVVLSGTPTDDTTLDYLRDTVGLITYMLDHGGMAVCDPQMLRWWNPAAWRSGLFDPGRPVPMNHTVILVSEEDDPSLNWFHTRGMRKFGRPDISVPAVPSLMEQGVIDLCNRMIEQQALGLVVAEGEEVRMDSLPPGGTMRHVGDLNDPDYNNVHIEITWPEFE